jgi:hypothetical protein
VADVGFVLVLVVFFAIAAAFVTACDKIVGTTAALESSDRQPAPAPAGDTGPGGAGPEAGVAA